MARWRSSPAAARRERHEIADHPQGVGPALRGPHDVLRHVGEEQRADAIVVARRRERQHGGDLHGEARFGVGTAEMQRPGLIHDEKDRELAFLHERLHERMAHPGRDVPVDGAKVVAVLILAHFRELDALAAEDGAILTGEERVDEIARPELDPLHVLQDFGSDCPPARAHRRRHGAAALSSRVRHGTPTASRILEMTRSVSTSSASASNVRSTRCRSTSGAIALTSSGTT